MALAKDKKAIAVTVTKADHDKLKILADKDSRSISSLVNKIIKDYLQSQ